MPNTQHEQLISQPYAKVLQRLQDANGRIINPQYIMIYVETIPKGDQSADFRLSIDYRRRSAKSIAAYNTYLQASGTLHAQDKQQTKLQYQMLVGHGIIWLGVALLVITGAGIGIAQQKLEVLLFMLAMAAIWLVADYFASRSLRGIFYRLLDELSRP